MILRIRTQTGAAVLICFCVLAMAMAKPKTQPAPKPVASRTIATEAAAIWDSLASDIVRKQSPAHAVQAAHPASTILPSDHDPLDVVLRRMRALLDHLSQTHTANNFNTFQTQLAALKTLANSATPKQTQKRKILFAVALDLQRQIAFANPALKFKDVLFIQKHTFGDSEKGGNHMCDQFFGFHGIRGGGVFVLENALSDSPKLRNVLEKSTCANGRFKGKAVDGKTGAFLSPELSFDGKEILFAWTQAEQTRYKWTPKSTYHLFKVNADGSGLTMMTDGPTNDFDPCYLPSGRIAFISERRGGYGRCHGRPVPSFTLHSMNGDASDIMTLSPHETNEWQPSVNNDGMIVYTRWDYVDRGFNQAHHPWSTTPDGRDPRSLHGNFAASPKDRPHMEMDVRAIPGSTNYLATACGHHGQAIGSIIQIDPSVPDDNKMSQVRRVTPEVLFPESEGSQHRGMYRYATAYPIDATTFLVSYDPLGYHGKGKGHWSPRYGVYLCDIFGNRVLLYRNPDISCLSPIPFTPRKRPPVIPHACWVGIPKGADMKPSPPTVLPKTGEVAVINVYDSTLPIPKSPKAKYLRITQLLPKTTPFQNKPRIGYGDQKVARKILGTVPVEADGSAFFKMPTDVPIYFQLLDENFVAIQSMRSATYVKPGEKLVCQGCHENRHTAAKPRLSKPLAVSRPASAIAPGPAGTNPFSYPQLIQPILDKRCVGCHAKNKKTPNLTKGNWQKDRYRWYASYRSLQKHSFYYDHRVFTSPLTIPGKFGARVSKLYPMLLKGHPDKAGKPRVTLPAAELRAIATWLDANSDFFGSYDHLDEQSAGKTVQPKLE